MLCGAALTDSVRVVQRAGWLRRGDFTIHNTNILEPLVVEFPTSAAKDVVNLVLLRNILSASSGQQYLLM